MAGASRVGHVRDMLFLVTWLLLGSRVLVYIHNKSWNYFLCRAWFWRAFGGGRLQFIVLTEPIKESLRLAGLNTERLNNTLTDGPEPEGLVPTKVSRLIWMGAVTESKGFVKACAVLACLRARNTDWFMDVYGSGPLVQCSGGGPGLVFHGFVSAEAKQDAWRGGGIFILPSTYANETQPLSIVEALANGVPFIATPIGGIPDMCGETSAPACSLLSANADNVHWADEIERIMGDYKRRSISAHSTYTRFFSRKAYATGVSKILNVQLS